jgi:biotin carboxylase
MRVLLIGYNDGVLTALDRVHPDIDVIVLEEPDLWENKKLAAKAATHPCLSEVRFGRYQQDEHFLQTVADLRGIDAVAPGLEYAVTAAAQAAQVLGPPGAGTAAAAILRDKLLLRQATSAAGMPGPAFREITSAADIAAFAGGRPCVVKPAGRQASLGVLLLDAGADPVAAWRECCQADEGNQLAQRPMTWRYLAEERMYGPEFSTECLVAAGQVLFLNLTAKRTASGRNPVELGHVVPASVADGGSPQPWRRAVEQLVEAVGFGTGILHAEWVRAADGIRLIECAGRPPGDKIMELVDLAYGVNITEAWIRLLANQKISPPVEPLGAASVRFVTTAAGPISAIDGVDAAREAPGVQRVDIVRRPGDHIHDLRSSWDRIGSVIAVGATPQEAEERARTAAARILVTHIKC